ncbi:hypothetical protein NDU88_005635 [Pleurodeles waltl]|uniref:Uncharacterized protein n=1 Tax=Pleurodeles waltl TaxID=8319 RepID=A0AAV7L839_PLEWA|nr:hypothetical protein NDU88_005635 [Pleurodeles waltl]
MHGSHYSLARGLTVVPISSPARRPLQPRSLCQLARTAAVPACAPGLAAGSQLTCPINEQAAPAAWHWVGAGAGGRVRGRACLAPRSAVNGQQGVRDADIPSYPAANARGPFTVSERLKSGITFQALGSSAHQQLCVFFFNDRCPW